MLLFLLILSALLLLSMIVSLIRNDYWLFQVFEYPRLQKLILVLLTLAGWTFYFPLSQFLHQAVVVGLCAMVVYEIYKIFPYTVLAKKEVKPVAGKNTDCGIKIFSANVYQDNKDYHRLLKQIKSTDPDIIFLMETNKDWARAVQSLQQTYPHFLLHPLENTYGILFFSRLPLERAKVCFLVKEDIPSVDAVAVLPCGQKIQLWGVHPEPPLPGENLYATAKNKELMKVAFMARDNKLPCIVFGDLNDVAWSHTTKLFRKTSQLLDPRIGRGFYNTFSAFHWFIRFPLDYIFCSREFGLAHMRRLPKNGSDHFASVVHLFFQPSLQQKQKPLKADSEELAEAAEMTAKPLPQT